MATTKIWAIKGNISKVLDYASNPDKTTLESLEQVLKYATNEEKTQNNKEQKILVTGVNCNSKTALKEMMKIKEKFNKVTGGNTAYHAYQSFKTGEVSAEDAHRIGLELAQKMFPEYQVVVATHLNTGTYHNHFIINSVNMFTGEKFNCNKGAYYKFRSISDKLCRKHNLIIIEHPKGKTPRDIYFAEKRGEPTKYNLMRNAIDEALSKSINMGQFKKIMYKLGYVINGENYLKYPTIRSINSNKATRLHRLGEKYTIQNITKTLMTNPYYIQNEYRQYIKKPLLAKLENELLKNNGKNDFASTVGDLIGLLVLMVITMVFPQLVKDDNNKNTKYEPISPEMKEEVRKIEIYSKRITLISQEKINTKGDLVGYIKRTEDKINELKAQRNKIRNKLRNCIDEDKIIEYKRNRDELTATIKKYRSKLTIAKDLEQDIPRIKGIIDNEKSSIKREEERIKKLKTIEKESQVNILY